MEDLGVTGAIPARKRPRKPSKDKVLSRSQHLGINPKPASAPSAAADSKPAQKRKIPAPADVPPDDSAPPPRKRGPGRPPGSSNKTGLSPHAQVSSRTRSGKVGRTQKEADPPVILEEVKVEEEEAVLISPEEDVKKPPPVPAAKKARPSKAPRKPRAASARTAKAKKGNGGPDAAKDSGVGVKDGGVKKKAPGRKKRVTLVTEVQVTEVGLAIGTPGDGGAGEAPALQSPSFFARIPQLAYSIGSRIASWVSPQRPPPPTGPSA